MADALEEKEEKGEDKEERNNEKRGGRGEKEGNRKKENEELEAKSKPNPILGTRSLAKS